MILLFAMALLGGIVNGTYQNYTLSYNGIDGITQTITSNFPWFWDFFLIVVYVSVALFLMNRQGMSKFVYTCFVGMIVTIIFAQYGLVGTTEPTIAIVLFGVVFIVDWLTGR